jgi:predicted methyltransferase
MSSKGGTMTLDELLLNEILKNHREELEEKIQGLEPKLRDVIHDKTKAQMAALTGTFLTYIQTEVKKAVLESLEDIGKESKKSAIAGLKTCVGEIKNFITSHIKTMEMGLQGQMSRSVEEALKSNNNVLLQDIVNHLHHTDSAVGKITTLIELKFKNLDKKVSKNSKTIAEVVSHVESLECQHGSELDVLS